MSIVVGGGKWQALKQEVLQRKPGASMLKPNLSDLRLHASTQAARCIQDGEEAVGLDPAVRSFVQSNRSRILRTLHVISHLRADGAVQLV